MDEYGEGIYPDLLRYYGTDMVAVARGDGPAPSLVLAQVQGLPTDSLTVALLRGGREFYGWNEDRYLAAETFDMLGVIARAAGNWAKKPPEIPAYPRPKQSRSAKPRDSKPKKPVTVADLFGRMSRNMEAPSAG